MSKIVELAASELAIVGGGEGIESVIRIVTIADVRDIIAPPCWPTTDGPSN